MCAMKKAQRQTSENAKLSLWQGFRSSIRNFPQIYVHPASCCANRRERAKDEALFCILLNGGCTRLCLCERETLVCIRPSVSVRYDMLYNSLIPTIREIETKNHSSQLEQYHG